MYVVQIIVLLVFVYFFFRIYCYYLEGWLDWQSVVLWVLFVLVFVVVVIFLIQVFQMIKDLLGFGRGFDVFFVVFIGLLFFIVFDFYLKIDKIEREIIELMRKVVIEFEEINEWFKVLEEKVGEC